MGKSMIYLNKARQTGLVLFVALIALVAMSLAAAALVRSVDTGVLVSGNLAFKQSATMSADSGVTAGYDFFNNTVQTSIAANPAFLDTNQISHGYIANMNALRNNGIDDIKDDAVWTNTWSRPATGNGNDATGKDTSGNTTRYIIERMCSRDGRFSLGGVIPGSIDEKDCLTGQESYEGNSKSGGNIYDVPVDNATGNPVYRVTARVTGPKNTKSFVQAYLY